MEENIQPQPSNEVETPISDDTQSQTEVESSSQQQQQQQQQTDSDRIETSSQQTDSDRIETSSQQIDSDRIETSSSQPSQPQQQQTDSDEFDTSQPQQPEDSLVIKRVIISSPSSFIPHPFTSPFLPPSPHHISTKNKRIDDLEKLMLIMFVGFIIVVSILSLIIKHYVDSTILKLSESVVHVVVPKKISK